MKKPDSQMWGDAEQSDIVRELLRAGRDAPDVADYDLEAGLQRHMNMVQIGAPAPEWAAEILGKGGATGLSAASGSVPWWGWLAASVLGVTSGAVVWSDALPANRSETPASEVRVVEDQRPAAPAVELPAVTLPAPSAPSVRQQEVELAGAKAGSERTSRRIARPNHRHPVAGSAPVSSRTRVEAAQAPATQPASPELSDLFAVPATTGTGSSGSPSKVASKRAPSPSSTTSRADDVAATPAAITAPRPDPEAQKRVAEARQRMAREAMLEREMRMLKVAQASLDHNPGRSLRLAQQGEHEFKDSLFTQERQYVLIAALARLGRHAEARELASDYLKRYPSGPFSERVRKALQD